MIRHATTADAESICDIYNYYVLNTIVTFEEEPVTVQDMQGRIETTTEKYPWLVYEEGNQVMGYAYAALWKSRCSYRHSLESTIYLRIGQERKGIGKALYGALFEKLSGNEVHAVIGGISLPNEGSVALHEKFGFEKVAQFREVGYKYNRWIDFGYW